MNILTEVLDPDGNGVDIGDVALILTMLAGLPTLAIGALIRWNAKRTGQIRAAEAAAMETRLMNHLDKRTKQIQEGANGGRSLGDLAERVGANEAVLAGIDVRLDLIEDMLKALIGRNTP